MSGDFAVNLLCLQCNIEFDCVSVYQQHLHDMHNDGSFDSDDSENVPYDLSMNKKTEIKSEFPHLPGSSSISEDYQRTDNEPICIEPMRSLDPSYNSIVKQEVSEVTADESIERPGFHPEGVVFNPEMNSFVRVKEEVEDYRLFDSEQQAINMATTKVLAGNSAIGSPPVSNKRKDSRGKVSGQIKDKQRGRGSFKTQPAKPQTVISPGMSHVTTFPAEHPIGNPGSVIENIVTKLYSHSENATAMATNQEGGNTFPRLVVMNQTNPLNLMSKVQYPPASDPQSGPNNALWGPNNMSGNLAARQYSPNALHVVRNSQEELMGQHEADENVGRFSAENLLENDSEYEYTNDYSNTEDNLTASQDDKKCSKCGNSVKSFAGYITCDICHNVEENEDDYLSDVKDTNQSHKKVLYADDFTVFINGQKADDVEAASSSYHKCQLCGKKFVSEKDCYIHFWAHSLKKTRDHFDCQLCDKKQKTKDGWRKHMTSHFYSEKNYSYQCNKCFQDFSTTDAIKRHMKVHRAKELRHECNICGNLLETAGALKWHLKQHEKRKAKMKEAEGPLNKSSVREPGKTGGSKQKEVHTRWKKSSKTYSCPKCKKVFKTVSGLTNHLKKLHSEMKPAQEAEILHFKKSSRRGNGRHKRRQCRICGLRCTSYRLLIIHERQRHRVDKHRCKYCERRFFYQGVYESHVRSHSGKRQFQCNQCSKTYPYISTLRRHKKIHERELHQSAKSLFNALSEKENSLENEETKSNIETIYGKKMVELIQRLQSGDDLSEKNYVCQVCGHTTEVHYDYLKHMESHTGERPFKCSICNKGFFARGHLNDHIIIHTGQKPFSCEVCGKAFNNKSSMRRHQTLHTGGKLLQCKMCDEQLSSSYLLKKHVAEVHNIQSKKYECPVCHKLLLTKSHLNSHVRVHSNDKSHECSQCGKHFVALNSLRRHEKIHAGTKPYQCDSCDMSFYLPSDLKKHNLRVHIRTDPFICDYKDCKETFQFKCDLNLHKEEHYNLNKEPKLGYFPCSKCDEVFQTAKDRYTHKVKAHKKKRVQEYQTCEYCGKKVLKIYMKVHVRKHTGETLACELCDKTFYDERMLKNHMLNHNGIKPHCCDVCGKRTVTSNEMKLHKRVHTGEKPFKCQYCERCFRDGSARKVHEMRHRGEKPHKCHECPMAYVTPCGLRRHLQMGHKEKPAKPAKSRLQAIPQKKKEEVDDEEVTESEVSDNQMYDNSEYEEEKLTQSEEMSDVNSSWPAMPKPLPPSVAKVERQFDGEADAFDIPYTMGKLPFQSRSKQLGMSLQEHASVRTMVRPESDEHSGNIVHGNIKEEGEKM